MQSKIALFHIIANILLKKYGSLKWIRARQIKHYHVISELSTEFLKRCLV